MEKLKIIFLLSFTLISKTIQDLKFGHWILLTGNYSNIVDDCFNSNSTPSEQDYLDFIYNPIFVNYSSIGMKIWVGANYVSGKYLWKSSYKEITQFPCNSSSIDLTLNKQTFSSYLIPDCFSVYVEITKKNPYEIRLVSGYCSTRYFKLCKILNDTLYNSNNNICCNSSTGLRENCSVKENISTPQINNTTTQIYLNTEISSTRFEPIEVSTSLFTDEKMYGTETSFLEFLNSTMTVEALTIESIEGTKSEFWFGEWSNWESCELENFKNYTSNFYRIKIDCSLVYSYKEMVSFIEFIKKSKNNETRKIKENMVRSLNKVSVEYATAQIVGRSFTIVIIISIITVVVYIIFLDLSKIFNVIEYFRIMSKMVVLKRDLNKIDDKIYPLDRIVVTRAKNDLNLDEKIFKIESFIYKSRQF
ncbi:unnamed protein product [Brachionus calyciflorus]|uniref:Uncharacterized protein n=1 Tax=Brachionus calyciflorus TaxID=104777 RepID=A0A813Z333_9BILA|nr:unnamed protein product [Brachionus calyciflorus]